MVGPIGLVAIVRYSNLRTPSKITYENLTICWKHPSIRQYQKWWKSVRWGQSAGKAQLIKIKIIFWESSETIRQVSRFNRDEDIVQASLIWSIERSSLSGEFRPARKVEWVNNCLEHLLGEIEMAVKTRPNYTWTKRPRELYYSLIFESIF